MVAGEDVAFADLFAVDGVLRFPFAPPGMAREIHGRAAIAASRRAEAGHRSLLEMDGVELLVRETDDPEVVVTEIEHYGYSRALDRPYRFRALAVIRVRNGEIVSYDDYMDPIAMAALLGRTGDLAAALAG
jgi:ketosteroid isomerase-like protein